MNSFYENSYKQNNENFIQIKDKMCLVLRKIYNEFNADQTID